MTNQTSGAKPGERDIKKSYMVYFDFTTVHRGSKFVGRSGELLVTTEDTPEQMMKSQELSNLIASFIHSKKPTWNILFMNIKQITKHP